MASEMRPAGYRPVTIDQISASSQRVLRNTYLLLALTMVPTVIGATIGMSTGGVVVLHPISTALLMMAAVFILQYAIFAARNSGLGVVLLLGMTFLLG